MLRESVKTELVAELVAAIQTSQPGVVVAAAFGRCVDEDKPRPTSLISAYYRLLLGLEAYRAITARVGNSFEAMNAIETAAAVAIWRQHGKAPGVR